MQRTNSPHPEERAGGARREGRTPRMQGARRDRRPGPRECVARGLDPRVHSSARTMPPAQAPSPFPGRRRSARPPRPCGAGLAKPWAVRYPDGMT